MRCITMAKRVTLEDVKQRLIEIDNNYKVDLCSEIEEFKGSKSIIKHKCLICGKFKTSVLKNLENGNGFICLECTFSNLSKNKLTSKKAILEKIKETDNTIILEFGISSNPHIKIYNGSESIIEHRCLLCGKNKESNYGNFIYKSGLLCRDCSYKNMSASMTLSFDTLKEKLISIHPNNNFVPVGEYNDRSTLFSFNCSNCGKLVRKSYDSLANGYPLCHECINHQRSHKLAFSKDKIKQIIESQNCKWLSGEYHNNTSILEIECSCGTSYKCSFAEFQHGQTKCQNCSKSKSLGERLLEEVIYFYCKEFDYSYNYQQTFEDLKSPKDNLLRYDFQILDKKDKHTLIEFHGEQHYKFIKFFYKTYEEFLEQQEYDLMKEQYALDKGYGFLVISYLDLLLCQEKLMNFLHFSNELKNKFYENINEIRMQLWKNQSILIFTIHQRFVGQFTSISEIVTNFSSKNIKISHSDISACLSNKRNQAKGFIFIRASDLNNLTSKIKHIKIQKPSLFFMVKLINVNNNKDFSIMSVTDATSFLNLKRSSRITETCYKNQKQPPSKKNIVNGYICEWINCPPFEPIYMLK